MSGSVQIRSHLEGTIGKAFNQLYYSCIVVTFYGIIDIKYLLLMIVIKIFFSILHSLDTVHIHVSISSLVQLHC